MKICADLLLKSGVCLTIANTAVWLTPINAIDSDYVLKRGFPGFILSRRNTLSSLVMVILNNEKRTL